MKQDAVLIGYSGHAYAVADIILEKKYSILGYCEKNEKAINPLGFNYLGYEREEETINKLLTADVFLGIGSNHIRSVVHAYLDAYEIRFPLLRHPKSIISKHAEIGAASVVMPGAIVNAFAKVGLGAILNTSCIVEHECLIHDFAHIAPGAVLAGNVSVGAYTFVGANAIIKQNITIGKNVTVGAGSVVLSNIPDGATAFGNPARIK